MRKSSWEEVIVVEGTKVRRKTERPREDYSAGQGVSRWLRMNRSEAMLV